MDADRTPLAPRDELAVRNLVAELAMMADTVPIDRLEGYLSHFTPDAVWASPAETRTGTAEIRAGAEERRRAGVQGPGSHSRHVVSTQAVWADGEDAVSESYFMSIGETTGEPEVRIIGHYRDRLRRTPEGWKVASRHVTFG